MPILGGTGSIPVPNFFLTTFLSKSREMWAAKGIRDTVAFPMQPDNSQDDLRFEVGAMRRLPLHLFLANVPVALPLRLQAVKRLDRIFSFHNDFQVLFRGGGCRA